MERAFYERHTVTVAQDLIGCLLIRRGFSGLEDIVVRITETEAYRGADDPASHAHRGVTPRNRLMFGQAGHLYVYLSYGMHYCMNIVTEGEGEPGAVLLRGAEVVQGLELVRANRPGVRDAQLLNGPGKLTKGLALDLAYNGYDVCGGFGGGELELLPPPTGMRPLPLKETGRIGISKGQAMPWRFVEG
ncbi:DNA-3-methyladenine glycosylase [Paenibacillus swuensis]|uniref:Putative 3-methyladenine DNA glycosylase n=2 Tax=Paenibacillus swuensis TaxID=1178515 RepID=A0A172TDM9_9BACL|nr:DNA-3-methyladenine glycosylase [Paenibacillus swuensis]